MTKRFENRQTQVKGFIINATDPQNVVTTPFDEIVSYVRSNDKAIALVSEKMQLDENPLIFVTVAEIINEKPKPIKYSDAKIYDLARYTFNSEEEAENEKNENEIIRAINWYEYEAAYWAVEPDGNYETDFVRDDSPLNMTKGDMRSFLAMSAADLTGFNIIGIHNCKKEATKRYCLITTEDLEKCVIK